MLGTIRISSKSLQPVKLTKSGYKKAIIELPNTIEAIQLFKAHNNLQALIDKKDPNFLKGSLSPEGKCMGARINILPDGKVLDKAYSLFAKDLTIHDESSNDHWDVMFKNPGGTYAYVYTLEKNNKHRAKKFKEVQKFEKHFSKLKRKVNNALKNDNDYLALPMFTLLKTFMRIGNETYYKANGHKGLTTLKKNDIKINGNTIEFSYLSKGGVPRKIIEKFPAAYIERLKKTIKPLKKNAFVFTSPSGKVLTDNHFKEAFFNYCGKEFYPHIVRSYFATKKAKDFLKTHKKSNKEEVHELFTDIAKKLGHKKFDKKSNEWVNSYNITINYYIQPEILKKIKKLM